mmetsp:Transcript_6518/g.11327  ORF Transcript_6518/g.11327 Transcript_6518/m.11327 type:complete len:219 (+) Transcript_6518:187-843(+)
MHFQILTVHKNLSNTHTRQEKIKRYYQLPFQPNCFQIIHFFREHYSINIYLSFCQDYDCAISFSSYHRHHSYSYHRLHIPPHRHDLFPTPTAAEGHCYTHHHHHHHKAPEDLDLHNQAGLLHDILLLLHDHHSSQAADRHPRGNFHIGVAADLYRCTFLRPLAGRRGCLGYPFRIRGEGVRCSCYCRDLGPFLPFPFLVRDPLSCFAVAAWRDRICLP